MYNKIFTKILDSSIWLEDDATRLVWFTMLAAMDEDGFCQFASIANLAHRARVSMEAAKSAVSCLEGPDENSSDPEHGGRRLERVQGGWVVLNAVKYRELVTREVAKEKTRVRVAKFRDKQRELPCNADVTGESRSVTPSEAVTEANVETESERKQARRPEIEFPECLNTPSFRSKWAEYITYRQKGRLKPLLAQSEAMQLRRLSVFGEVIAASAIEQTIANGWQGIFPERIQPQRTNGRTSAHARAATDREFDRTGLEAAPIPTPKI